MNSLFANEGDGYKTTSAPDRLSVFLRKERSDRGKSRLPSKVNPIIETAIKKIYFTAEQPDVAAVIEEVQLKCFNTKKGAACSLLITCGVWVIECLHFARIRAGLPHIPAEDVSKGFNKRLWILSA